VSCLDRVTSYSIHHTPGAHPWTRPHLLEAMCTCQQCAPLPSAHACAQAPPPPPAEAVRLRGAAANARSPPFPPPTAQQHSGRGQHPSPGVIARGALDQGRPLPCKMCQGQPRARRGQQVACALAVAAVALAVAPAAAAAAAVLVLVSVRRLACINNGSRATS